MPDSDYHEADQARTNDGANSIICYPHHYSTVRSRHRAGYNPEEQFVMSSLMSWELCRTFHIISHERRLSSRLVARLSFDNDERAAHFRCLILLVGSIYGHLQTAQRSGPSEHGVDSSDRPSFVTTCMEAVGFAQATTSIPVSAEKNVMELSRTIRCIQKHSLPGRDGFEWQRLTG
jgi:hypothetical protein